MSKLFIGSINLTELLNAAKERHSAFKRAGKKNQVYGNLTLWLNDKPDEYGNLISVNLNPEKDSQDAKIYVANFKEVELNKPLTSGDVNGLPGDDDLPF